MLIRYFLRMKNRFQIFVAFSVLFLFLSKGTFGQKLVFGDTESHHNIMTNTDSVFHHTGEPRNVHVQFIYTKKDIPIDKFYIVARGIDGIAAKAVMRTNPKNRHLANAVMKFEKDGYYKVYMFNPKYLKKPLLAKKIYITSNNLPTKGHVLADAKQKYLEKKKGKTQTKTNTNTQTQQNNQQITKNNTTKTQTNSNTQTNTKNNQNTVANNNTKQNTKQQTTNNQVVTNQNTQTKTNNQNQTTSTTKTETKNNTENQVANNNQSNTNNDDSDDGDDFGDDFGLGDDDLEGVDFDDMNFDDFDDLDDLDDLDF